jgi:hypothetical protein
MTMIERIHRTYRRSHARVARASVFLGATLILAGLGVAVAGPASASTLNGIAVISPPGLTTPLTSGASTIPFTVSLPAQAACDGDTATGGYHIYSYLVEKGTNLSTVTFVNFPSVGFGLVDNTGNYYGPVDTAIGTGQIVSIPNNFEWGPLVSGGGVTLAQLLYTGTGATASGIWETGLACANTSGVLADNWNIEITFTASSTDPTGFTWSAVPTGSSAPAFTSATSTTFTSGSLGTFTPVASGSPTPTITESGVLPAGVTFSSAGVLAGTPTVTGSFPITFTATNGIGSPATQSFTLTVQAPTSPTTTTPTTSPTTSPTTAPTTTATDPNATTTTTTAGGATTTGSDSSGSGTGATTDPSSGSSLAFTGFHTAKGLGLGLLGVGIGFLLLGWGYRKKIRPSRRPTR